MHPFIEHAEANFTIDESVTPFKAKKYHKELAQIFTDNRFVLVRKYRQGGFSTFVVLWALYNCLTKANQNYLLVSPTNEMSINMYQKLLYPASNLPYNINYSYHGVLFSNGSSIDFRSCGHLIPTRGRRLDCIIYDEMAIMRNMEEVYDATYPCISLGGKAIGISTPKGKNNWFYKTYKSKKWFNYSPSVYDDPEVLDRAKGLYMSADTFSEEYLAKFSCKE